MLKDQSTGLHPVPALAGLIFPETKLLFGKAVCRGHVRPRRNVPQIEARQGSAPRRQAKHFAGRRAAFLEPTTLFRSL